MASILEDAEQNITPRMRMLLDRVWQEWKPLEIDITAVREEIERISNQDAGCQRNNDPHERRLCSFHSLMCLPRDHHS